LIQKKEVIVLGGAGSGFPQCRERKLTVEECIHLDDLPHVMVSPGMDVEDILAFAGRMLPRSDEAWLRVTAASGRYSRRPFFQPGCASTGRILEPPITP